MPLVNVLMNGRAYTVGCDDGQEDHVRELGQFLDNRVRELSGSVGSVGDTRLFLMAGLVVADELSDALNRLEECKKELEALKSERANSENALENQDNRAADVLEGAAIRLEAIAARLAHA